MDPGWLFVAAGLTLCVAGVLIPAQQSLADLTGQLTRIEHLQAVGRDGIEAHEKFLDRLRQRDPAVFRRLAAAHLNLMPAGDTLLLVANSSRATVTDWIGRSVASGTVTAAPPARTWLTRLTAGTRRLWVLGFGVLVVFVGLLVDGRPSAMTGEVEWSDDGSDEDGDWVPKGDKEDDDAEEELDDDEEEYEEDEQDDGWEQDKQDDDEQDDDEEDDDEEDDDDDEEDDDDDATWDDDEEEAPPE